jgi:phosphatidylserine decarboxylase
MYGDIEAGQLGQIKGVSYDLHALLGGDDTLAATFLGGRYMTFYLAPHNYHRVHMPLDGRLRATRYIPGRLFGVNPRCVRSIPRLFTRNERLVCCFDTQVGPFALVLVGAFIVGGIQLRTAGRVCPPHRSTQRHTSYNNSKEAGGPFARGHPMGHFMLGSSVVILSAANAVDIDGELVVDQPVRLNQPLGGLVTESANPPLHCCPKGPSSQQPNRNNHVNLGTY